MKALLKFNLDEADEAREHLRCIKSMDLALVVWEIQQKLIKENLLTIDNFNDILKTYSVNIDELIV